MEAKFNFYNLREYLENTIEGIDIPEEAEIGETNFHYENLPLGIMVDSTKRNVYIFFDFISCVKSEQAQELIEAIKKWNGFEDKFEKWYKIEYERNFIYFNNAPNPKHTKIVEGGIAF